MVPVRRAPAMMAPAHRAQHGISTAPVPHAQPATMMRHALRVRATTARVLRAVLTLRAPPVMMPHPANRGPKMAHRNALLPVLTRRVVPLATRPPARQSRVMMAMRRPAKARGINPLLKATVRAAPPLGSKKRLVAMGLLIRPSGLNAPENRCLKRAASPVENHLANLLEKLTARADLPPKGASPAGTLRRANRLASAPKVLGRATV